MFPNIGFSHTVRGSFIAASTPKCINLGDRSNPYEILDMSQSSSPDINRTDYKIWVMIQQRVYQTKVQDVNDLKQRLIDVLAGVEQSELNSRCH